MTAYSRGPTATHPDKLERSRAETTWRWRLTAGILAVCLAGLVLAAIGLGPYPITAGQALHALWTAAFHPDAATSTVATVVLDIRLPRIVTAIAVGAALASAGSAYQTLFRNPLVSPDILGVTAGAGLGAVLGIFLSLPVVTIQVFAFLGGLATVALVSSIAAAVRGHDPILVLVLAGVVVGALAGAAISMLKVLADPYDQLPAITFWLLGSLASAQWSDILPTLPAVALGLLPLIALRWRMNVLSLGDDEAKSLGIDTARLRLIVICAATLMTASVVAISGVIGWIGLVIPHMARMLVGPNFHRALLVAILLGAAYLLGVDTLARTMAQTEVPIGILTALIGAPFFLWLLATRRHGWS